MKNIGGNKKIKLHEAISYIAIFSPLYLSYFIGKTYQSGLIIAMICSWGFNNIYNKIPSKYDKKTIEEQWQKKRKLRRLIKVLKQIEAKKRLNEITFSEKNES